ncbi:MAG TPA: cytochrome-c oxidase, cbb3-type subunit II, partial [Planctomycetota bacterium]|nr:cytochrome-c oxidase, cbb3-type subunit II [Planctomycetota bacterium]
SAGEAPPLARGWRPAPAPPSQLDVVSDVGKRIDYLFRANWHRAWEGKPLVFTTWVVVAVVVASLFEIVPTFAIKSNVPTIASVTPYTPLEQEGRDIYVAEGCYNCHSQMIRPMRHETERYGEYSKAGEFVYDRPFQWGSRRIGPDLAREGQTNTSVAWHVRHFYRPQDLADGSLMPSYAHLWRKPIDYAGLERKLAVLSRLGHPYDAERGRAEELARAQAAELHDRLVAEDPMFEVGDLRDKQVLALTAYVLRLGVDIAKPAPVPGEGEVGIAPAAEEVPHGTR